MQLHASHYLKPLIIDKKRDREREGERERYMEEVKLFGMWSSPFVKRVEIALKMKGVEYEYIEEDLENKSALVEQCNPIHKKVPILVHNGKAIAESMVILEYIDQVWEGPPILPRDPHQRAMARFWAKFVDEKCIPTLWNACWSRGEERERLMEEATEALQFLEHEINGNNFFGGDNVGLVDIAANIIAYWIPVISEQFGVKFLREDKFPNLCRWADEYCNNSFVKENLPHKETMLARFKGR